MTKQNLNFLLPFLCLILSLIFPKACITGVKNGLELALNSALPALFPALVLSGLLCATMPLENKKSALLSPFFLGLFCGFPVGAKTVCTLTKEKKLSPKKAEKLLPFVSGASPGFLMVFCTNTLVLEREKGLFLFFIQSAFSLLGFLIFFGKGFKEKEKKKEKIKQNPSLFLLLPNALSQAASSFLYISACIIFFSFLSELALSLFSLGPIKASLLSLFLELSGGVKSLTKVPEKFIFPLCALGCGWNGMSVHLQTLGLIYEAKLSPKFYFFSKGIFALLFFLSAYFLQKLL